MDWEAVPSLTPQPELADPNLMPAANQQSTIAFVRMAATSVLRWIK